MNLHEMTNEKLRIEERNYTRSGLEDGEGYNPYTAEINRREAIAPQTLQGRRSVLCQKLKLLDCALARESGTYDVAARASIRNQIAVIEQQIQFESSRKWTLRVTIQRRGEWNDWFMTGPITRSEIAARELAQGWSADDLRRAVKQHKL